MSRIKPVNIFLYTFSVVLVISVIAFLYLAFSPIDVLQNWKLTVPTNQTYHAGSTVELISKYDKVRQASGQASRYIQCKKPNSNQWDGFILLAQSRANKPITATGSSVNYVIIPNLPVVPSTCRIYINVDYTINQIRSFSEQNYSNEFRVERGQIISQQTSADTVLTNSAPTHQDFVISDSPKVYSSSPVIRPSDDTVVVENAPKTSASNVIQRTINGLTTQLQNVVNGLRALP